MISLDTGSQNDENGLSSDYLVKGICISGSYPKVCTSYQLLMTAGGTTTKNPKIPSRQHPGKTRPYEFFSLAVGTPSVSNI